MVVEFILESSFLLSHQTLTSKATETSKKKEYVTQSIKTISLKLPDNNVRV